MNIAIIGRNINPEWKNEINTFLQALNQKGLHWFMNESLANDCKSLGLPVSDRTFSNAEECLPLDINFAICIGGDGTILNSIQFIFNKPVPIAGINTGRLGFLASVSIKNACEIVDSILKSHYSHDNRTLLHVESESSIFGGIPFALNDFVIHKKDSSSMITIHTFINGEFLNSYWCDGLIISTPTGSTGYNLSCGGPILYPNSESFAITPISPHNLNVRPMIISDRNVISFEIEGRGNSFLCSLDSRSESMPMKTQLAVRKADFSILLARFNGDNFLQTLREKLMWGLDNRNYKQS